MITGKFFAITDEELVGWVNRFYINGRKMDLFKEMISKTVNEREGGQLDMFVIMNENQFEEFKLAQKKKTVEAKSVQALHHDMSYLMTLEILHEEGRLGLPGSPYSTGSPVRLLLKNAELIRRIAQNLESGISGPQRQETISAADYAIPILEDKIRQEEERQLSIDGEEVILFQNGNSNGNSEGNGVHSEVSEANNGITDERIAEAMIRYDVGTRAEAEELLIHEDQKAKAIQSGEMVGFGF